MIPYKGGVMPTIRHKAGEKGFVLVTLYLVLPLLLMLVGTMLGQVFGDVRASMRSGTTMRSVYLAEAGMDYALVQLRSDYAWTGDEIDTTGGNFVISVEDLGSDRLRVTSQGISSELGGNMTHSLEMIVERSIPDNFYDNVIWAAQNLQFNGSSYSVNGTVRHGDTSPSSTGNVAGTVTYDPETNPLPGLSYSDLYEIAQAQGNVYDAERLGNGHSVFPDSFWYQEPTDPSDPATGIPNVNYVTTDLVLNGNIGTIGGFFVVVGDVLTDPTAAEDTTINGNGQINGAIYSRGNFRINGGGSGLNINGGIWTGGEARLNGGATMTYNYDYMHAIEALDINPDVAVVSWQDLGTQDNSTTEAPDMDGDGHPG
jgi:hypothetical protein